MLWNKIAMLAGLVVSSAWVQTAWSFDCHSYDYITSKLERKYGEQIVFNGFNDSKENVSARAIYEFWANPKRGNWSLIARRLMLFKNESGTFNRSCVFILNSGKQHIMSTGTTQTSEAGEIALEAAESTAMPYVNCISQERHAKALKDRYNEIPLVHALTDDDTVVQIYGSESSWTITRAKIREIRNTMTGVPVMDTTTGQKIHQLCSDPAISGRSWGMVEHLKEYI